jgi:heat shock factor-binding protein 1
MLDQMQERFKGMSENIVGRIDEMGNRIEDLENSIAELVKESNNIDEDGQAEAAPYGVKK